MESLRAYKGPVQIYAARDDTIIPPDRAKALARQVPTARLTLIPGGHNDWAASAEVAIQYK